MQIHTVLEVLSHQTGTVDAVHGLTDLGETIGLGQIGIPAQPDGHSNLVTDVLNAPADLLDGDLAGIISNVGHDLNDIVNAAGDLVSAIVLRDNDPTNPIPELVQGIGHDLQTLPILSINDGDGSGGGLLGGSGGGLLDGLVGDLSHSSSNHLVDVSVGPEQSQDGLALNLLAAPEAGPQHAIDVNAVDVGPTGPHLADLGVLTGDNGLPLLGGSGADGLVGNLLNLGTSSSDTSPTPPATSPTASPVVETGNLDLGAIVNADHGILNLHGVHVI